MKTEVKTKTDLKKEAIEKDKKRAEELMKAYASLVADHDRILKEYNEKATPIAEEHDKKLEPIRTVYQGRLSPINASITEAKKELLEIGERQKKKLFTNDNWKFDDIYYLHIKRETQVTTGPTFSLANFIRKFGQYVDVKFKIKELKKIFTDADDRGRMMKYDIDLTQEETVEIKASKANESVQADD